MRPSYQTRSQQPRKLYHTFAVLSIGFLKIFRFCQSAQFETSGIGHFDESEDFVQDEQQRQSIFVDNDEWLCIDNELKM